MWNPSCEKDAGKQYYLDFVDDNHKKISMLHRLEMQKTQMTNLKKNIGNM